MDGVELVIRTEKEFNIQIADAEATAVRTVGQLIGLVCHKLPMTPERGCLTARTFYCFRRDLTALLPLHRAGVKPAAPLAELIPMTRRRELWRQLQARGWRLPPLCPSVAINWVALTLVLMIVSVLGIAASPNYGLIALAILAAFPLGMLAAWITRPWAVHMPEEVKTMRDIVLRSIPFDTTADVRGQWTQAEVAERVRLIIGEELGIHPEKLPDDARFVDDLGMD
jgi:acyl carrier protein